MFQSLDQLIEEAFILAFPGKAQEQKQLFRFELEAMVNAAATRLALDVANGPNYRWLQRSIVVPLNQARRALTFPPSGQLHPTDGARVGLSIVEGSVTPATANALGIASEQLTPDATGNIASCAVEWGCTGATEILVLIRPATKLETIPFSVLDGQNAMAVSVNASGGIVVMQNGSSVGTVSDTLLTTQRVRIEFDADGIASLVILSASGVQLSATVLTNVTITEPCGIVFVFPNAATVAVMPTLVRGVVNKADLPADSRLLLNTIATMGSVAFENPDAETYYPQPLGYLEDDTYQTLPRMAGFWYWSLTAASADGAVGAAIKLYPGDRASTAPSTNIRVTGNVIPTWQDIPDHLHDALVEQLVMVAQRRTIAGATVVQKVKR